MYLTSQRCKPLEGHRAMSVAEVDCHLQQVSGWALVGGISLNDSICAAKVDSLFA